MLCAGGENHEDRDENRHEDGFMRIVVCVKQVPDTTEVKIDPDNSIVESNEKNNIASQNVNIESVGAVSDFLGQKGTCPIIFVIVAAVIIGILTYYILRSRKKVE